LVELGESEALGVLHKKEGGVGDVDTDLDDRGGDENLGFSRTEGFHDGFLLDAGHPPMEQGAGER
jgi:hypothetical protein